MTEIIYDTNNLTVDIRYDKQTETVKWSIHTNPDFTPTFTATQIKTLVETLQKSLDLEWKPQT